MLAPNTILQNRYRIVRELGHGGMGEVYEVLDDRLGCLVALKKVTLTSHANAYEAFQHEAKILARLRHSALPKVTDYFDEADCWFLVMEFVPGYDLGELLALRHGPFPQELVMRWTQELLKLLGYLHAQRPPILHLDIKPSNLKVTKQEEIFLLDFGLAAGERGRASSLSDDSTFRGYTPAYSPLEQVQGHETDVRSDLYSLGATMYQLLTGECPVVAIERAEAFYSGRPDPLRPISTLNADASPAVADVIHSAMALWRDDRPASASEMLRSLNEACAEGVIEPSKPLFARRSFHEGAKLRREEDFRITTTIPEDKKGEAERPIYADKNVQFTVYSPIKIKPEKAYTVLAFAHLAKRPEDAPRDEPDPGAEVKQQASRILGSRTNEYSNRKEPSLHAIPRGGEVTFMPAIKGVTFIPPSRSFPWRKKIHREEFEMLAPGEVEGKTLTGSVTVFLGSIIIAEVGLTVSVDRRAEGSGNILETPHSAWRLRQIFASYSHKDTQIVNELAHLAPIFGAQYLIDRTHLRPGEDWGEGLRRLIKGADVFQLFWSSNSMRSPEVGKEIDYAVGLGRSNFILPTYWEDPLPRSSEEGLPPRELDRLHFYRIYPGLLSRLSSHRSEYESKSTSLASPPRHSKAFSAPPEFKDDEKFTTQASPFEEKSVPGADRRTSSRPYHGSVPRAGSPHASSSSKSFSPVLLGCSVLIVLSVVLIVYYFFTN